MRLKGGVYERDFHNTTLNVSSNRRTIKSYKARGLTLMRLLLYPPIVPKRRIINVLQNIELSEQLKARNNEASALY